MNEYVDILSDSREEAINEMMENAKELDADAVINVRFMTSSVMQNAAEVLVYGTAVKLK